MGGKPRRIDGRVKRARGGVRAMASDGGASRATVIGLIALGLVLASLVAIAVLPGRIPRGSPNAVAVIDVTGSIQASGSLFGTAATPDYVRGRLERVASDASIAAVVLRMNSPGGTVASSQEMAEIVRDFSKPVIVSMADVAASGGYYVASQADRIVAEPGTLTGSIGVIWANYDMSGLMRKLGVEVEAITAGKHKDMFLPGRRTARERRIVQRMVDQMHEQFIAAVADGRGLRLEEVRKLATGRLYTGEQALRLGLIDELGGLATAVTAAEETAGIDGARVVELEGSLLERLFSGSGGYGLRVRSPALPDRLTVIERLFDVIAEPRF